MYSDGQQFKITAIFISRQVSGTLRQLDQDIADKEIISGKVMERAISLLPLLFENFQIHVHMKKKIERDHFSLVQMATQENNFILLKYYFRQLFEYFKLRY